MKKPSKAQEDVLRLAGEGHRLIYYSGNGFALHPNGYAVSIRWATLSALNAGEYLKPVGKYQATGKEYGLTDKAREYLASLRQTEEGR